MPGEHPDPTDPESNSPALIGTCPNSDGSTTYRYEYPTAVDVGFGTTEGFVITGYPDVPEQN